MGECYQWGKKLENLVKTDVDMHSIIISTIQIYSTTMSLKCQSAFNCDVIKEHAVRTCWPMQPNSTTCVFNYTIREY